MSTSLYRRVLARRFIAVPANCAKSLAVCNTASSDMASLDMRQRHLHVGICRDVNIVGRYRGRNGKVRSFANDNKSFQSILNKIKDDNSSDSSAKKEDDNGASTSSTAGEKKATEAGAESDSNTADSPKSASTDASSSFNMDPKDLLQKASILARESYAKVLDNVKLAWLEMTQRDSADGVLSKKVHQAASFKRAAPKEEGAEEEPSEETAEVKQGGSALVFVKEPSSAWEQMKNRLQESPFIREMMKRSRSAGKIAADTPIGQTATKAAQGIKDKLEDAREFWETSQNPLVYSLSGMWENVTGETEEGIAIAAIKRLDPSFDKEEWSTAVRKDFAPKVIKAHLEGDLRFLKKWLGEACYNKLAADVRTRKNDGIVFDPHVLAVDENQTILRYIESGGVTGPIILAIYMVQQINCIRKKGEIVEGGEGNTCARFYSLAFQQEYVEEEGVVKWKVVDYEFTEKIPYY